MNAELVQLLIDVSCLYFSNLAVDGPQHLECSSGKNDGYYNYLGLFWAAPLKHIWGSVFVMKKWEVLIPGSDWFKRYFLEDFDFYVFRQGCTLN